MSTALVVVIPRTMVSHIVNCVSNGVLTASLTPGCAIYNYRKRRSAPVKVKLFRAIFPVATHVTMLRKLIVYYRFISM